MAAARIPSTAAPTLTKRLFGSPVRPLAVVSKSMTERSQIESYIKSFALEECLDEALNKVVEKRPGNPYMAIASFLESKTIAEILDVKIACCIVGRGLMGVEARIITNVSSFAANISDMTYATNTDGDLIKEYAVLQEKAKECLKGMDPRDIVNVDEVIASIPGMDSCVALAISMACCRAGARHKGQELYRFLAELAGTSPSIPVPVVSVLARATGGSIATCQIITLTPTTPSFFEGALEATLKATMCVQNYIDVNKTVCTVTDCGCPCIISPTLADAVKLVQAAISEGGLEGGLKMGVDVRASDVSFIEDDTLQYRFEIVDGPATQGEDLVEALLALWKETDLISLEDPVLTADTSSLQQMKEKMPAVLADMQTAGSGAYNIAGVGGESGCGLQIIADSNISKPEHIAVLAQQNLVFNTVKLRLRKIGSVSGAMALGRACEQAQIVVIAGCDEGAPESTDSFISDLAVAMGIGQFAGGGLSACEYSCKFQRILEIARDDDTLPFAGRNFRK